MRQTCGDHGNRPGLVDAGDRVEHGRLAGAVGADHRVHLAGLDAERHVLVGDEAAEAHGDAVDLEDGQIGRAHV